MSNLDVDTKTENAKFTVSPQIPGAFHRQLPLLDEIKKLQENCLHTLTNLSKEILVCCECGAIWVK